MLSNQQTVDINHIYKLRYTAYLGNQSIDPNPFRIFKDAYDGSEHCHSHIEYVDGQPAGSIRACIYRPDKPDLKVPAMENYSAEIAAELGERCTLVEANKYTIHPNFQRRKNRLKFKLYGYIFNVAWENGADYIIGAIRPSQAAFYKKMCFAPISAVKRSLHMNFETVLMACPIHEAKQYVAHHHRQYGG